MIFICEFSPLCVDKRGSGLSFPDSEREVSQVLGSHVFRGEVDACNVHVCASDSSNGKIARECESCVR